MLLEVLANARKATRSDFFEFIREIFDDFIELHGDRCFMTTQAIVEE